MSCDPMNLGRDIDELISCGIDGLHVDIMDGHFAPNIAFGLEILPHLRRATTLPIHVHIMATNPELSLKACITNNMDYVFIHQEIDGYADIISQYSNSSCEIGIAINPDTKIDMQAMKNIRNILIMTVQPGFCGQKFQKDALKKIDVRQEPELIGKSIWIDGGVNVETTGMLPCNISGIIVGSGIGKPYNNSMCAIRTALKQIKL